MVLLLCQLPAYHTLTESTPDMLKPDLPSLISHPTPRPWFTTEGDLNNATICLSVRSRCLWYLRMSILRGWSSRPHRSPLNATPRDLHSLARGRSTHGQGKRHNSIMSSRGGVFLRDFPVGSIAVCTVAIIAVDFCASTTPRPCSCQALVCVCMAKAALAAAGLGKYNCTLHDGLQGTWIHNPVVVA